MAKSMSPSEPITPGQIAKFCAVLEAALRKSGLPSEPTQQVLERQGANLADEFVASVRKRVYAISISDPIVRRVTVDRTRAPQDVLDAISRTQYTDRNVVKSMPHGESDEVEVVFFKIGRFVSDDELEKEYELHGLKPADPYSLAQVNIDDPAFAVESPNGTHWKGKGGRWCRATFRQCGERQVRVRRNDYYWDTFWFFGGVRKD